MSRLVVQSNQWFADKVYQMVLSGAKPHEPGQFVMVEISKGIDFFLRRPFSIADSKNDRLTLLYKVIGRGTSYMTTLIPGDTLDVLEQLGNGFRIDPNRQDVCLIGGGSGVFPLLGLARRLHERGIRPTAFLGFDTKQSACLISELSRVCQVAITTMDGTLGEMGNVCLYQAMYQHSYYYAVGPMAMLKAIAQKTTNGQMSLEERMGCGFGACMGCTIMTKKGPAQICKDGPVFSAGDLIWE
ncbi:MAG: dihydroorotate dehydrogenase electron transfer subunit [Candidatus Izemoplasmatales bacterium]|jgi:dihydroorotate dehydrogenase electron transfer subunit|nr:dihydroorotate dehydrogenase electron transfer subunit [Candidatus Izemoplasmatales bacterium]NLF49381.1 dihydroorotate dehydrogenase electron transfer subunit [Acholeplasmataceae bacterium]MDD4355003.1 dihydroorotate dehydrogenase electron transfer subunit [Candidatus Izemoplasmatales bacterium]MDD4987829.1 dihydroorotate dehydrogenase electron transfer subunit [Candidatus Izemoplasmatales bacterium]MDD5601864.1 dihydroorotate dehydrogenase electron transfer subunit [Candidatus Izemoplasmat